MPVNSAIPWATFLVPGGQNDYFNFKKPVGANIYCDLEITLRFFPDIYYILHMKISDFLRC